MFSLSIALLLCLLVALPPLKLWLLITTGIVQSPGEIFIAAYGGSVSLFEYGVPLAIFFGVLARKSTRTQIKIQSSTLWTLRALSAVVVACWLSLKQNPTEGKLLALLVLAAVALSSVFIIHVFIKSFGFRPVLISLIGTISLMSLPLMSQIVQKESHNKVWDEWCAKAGDHFHSTPDGMTRVQFKGMGELPVFKQIQGDRYELKSYENVGNALSNRGYLIEYEDNNPTNFKAPLALVRTGTSSREPLSASAASHLVTLHFLSEVQVQSQSRFQGLVISVIDMKTQQTIAERTIIDDLSGKRACGKIYNDKIDTTDFVIRALALQPVDTEMKTNESAKASANPAVNTDAAR